MIAINAATDALIAIDVQNDFCPGGALAVAKGDEVVPAINRLARRFAHLIATQDWHPAGHSSFVASHPGAKPFATIEVGYGAQTLWPQHCVQGSPGAKFHRDLDLTRAQLIVRKGFRPDIDSYSAFFENDRKTPTGLRAYLGERGFARVFFAGVATDYCVAFSAIDAATHGFAAHVIVDACRAIDLDGSLDGARRRMLEAGVRLIEEADIGQSPRG